MEKVYRPTFGYTVLLTVIIIRVMKNIVSLPYPSDDVPPTGIPDEFN